MKSFREIAYIVAVYWLGLWITVIAILVGWISATPPEQAKRQNDEAEY